MRTRDNTHKFSDGQIVEMAGALQDFLAGTSELASAASDGPLAGSVGAEGLETSPSLALT